MDLKVGCHYILGPQDKYLDGPFMAYLGALTVWFFYYSRDAKIKQWTEKGWDVNIALWVKDAWKGS